MTDWTIAMSEPLHYPRVYDVFRQIPYGQVATYGQVAEVVGPPLTAQDIGDAMAALRHHHPDPPPPGVGRVRGMGAGGVAVLVPDGQSAPYRRGMAGMVCARVS
jgi:methylated-DNA-protein-cysteine methyltransferase-like protein